MYTKYKQYAMYNYNNMPCDNLLSLYFRITMRTYSYYISFDSKLIKFISENNSIGHNTSILI